MLEKILLISGVWATLISGIWVLFYAMENTTPPESKKTVSEWLKSLIGMSISETLIETPRLFNKAFDRIFGYKHLSIQCFLKSSMASLIVVIVMLISWSFLYPTSLMATIIDEPDFIVTFFLLVTFLNFIPDYISLFQTRLILKYIEHAGIRWLSVLLVLDLIITGLIFALGLGIFIILAGVNVDIYLSILSDMIQFRSLGNRPPVGILFYSTFFTSVWLYLFLAASISVKFLHSMGRIGNWIITIIEVEKKPFQSMGLIIILLTTLAFIIYIVIQAIC